VNDFLLETYIRFNLLLAVAFLLWILTKYLSRAARFDVCQGHQLKIARFLFVGVLLLVPALALLTMLLPDLALIAMTALQGLWASNDIPAIAGVGIHLLQQSGQPGTGSLDATFLLGHVLFLGVVIRALYLWNQLSNLRRAIDSATIWKVFGRVRILFSRSTRIPFSTSALGSYHVVLPTALLGSGRSLQIVLKHELQHLRNGDLEWIKLLELVKLLCFWNPAAYFWRSEFGQLQEYACDEALISRRKVNSKDYGECLLEMASALSGSSMRSSGMVVPFFQLTKTRSQLKRRILMLSSTRVIDFPVLKSLAYAIILGFSMAGSAVTVFADSSEPGIEKKSDDSGTRVVVLCRDTSTDCTPSESFSSASDGMRLAISSGDGNNQVKMLFTDPAIIEALQLCMETSPVQECIDGYLELAGKNGQETRVLIRESTEDSASSSSGVRFMLRKEPE